MKKKQAVFFGFAVLLLAAIFTTSGCDTGTGGGTGTTAETVSYTTTTGGKTYTLVITENTSRAAYAPQKGDKYVLTITPDNTRSTGTVESSGTTLTLKPSNSATTFTVTVSGSGTISAIKGTITLTDNKTVQAPGGGGGGGGGTGGSGGGGGGSSSGNSGNSSQTVTIQDLAGKWFGQWRPGLECIEITTDNKFELQGFHDDDGQWKMYLKGEITTINGTTISAKITNIPAPQPGEAASEGDVFQLILAADKKSLTFGSPYDDEGIFIKLSATVIPDLQGTWLGQGDQDSVIISGTHFEIQQRGNDNIWVTYFNGRINFDGTKTTVKQNDSNGDFTGEEIPVILAADKKSLTFGSPYDDKGIFIKLPATAIPGLQGTWLGKGQWLGDELSNKDLKFIVTGNTFEISPVDGTPWYWKGIIYSNGTTISAKLIDESPGQSQTPPGFLGTFVPGENKLILGSPVAWTFTK
ncbi:hypothetical protein LQZ21_13235 [Treponema sp. TIM-1]|uniref:hypothetical protein n=1 Tax=Treponema sp. TIM-1 TaxID=2898417 RepID=UPI00398169B2